MKTNRRQFIMFGSLGMLSAAFAQNRLKLPGPKTAYAKAKSVVIPKVKFEDASLKDAFSHLRQRIRELSKDGKTINILYACKKETQLTKISLELEGQQASEIFYLMTKLAPITIKYEDHAMIVMDKKK